MKQTYLGIRGIDKARNGRGHQQCRSEHAGSGEEHGERCGNKSVG